MHGETGELSVRSSNAQDAESGWKNPTLSQAAYACGVLTKQSPTRFAGSNGSRRMALSVRMRCFFKAMSLNVPSFDLLTMAEVAKLLHVSKAHVSNLAAGKVHGCLPLPAITMGRRMLVRRETLQRWLEANEGTINQSPGTGPRAHRR
jgi:excisionase family DNA binding protein